jgi:nucleoside-diphosphate-sugar epimerase
VSRFTLLVLSIKLQAHHFQIFAKLLKHNEKAFEKLRMVRGDLQEIELGIAADDQSSLVNEVEIVFHAAADVRFDESLKEATEINVRGTREIMLLSQRMRHLSVFIYVSTFFCTPGFDVRESCELLWAFKVCINLIIIIFSLQNSPGSRFHDKTGRKS